MTTSALPLTDGYNEMPWTCTGCGIAVDPGYYTGPGTSDPTKCAGHRVGQWRKCGYPVHYYKKGTGPQYDPRPDGKCKVCGDDEGHHHHHSNGNKYCKGRYVYQPRKSSKRFCCNCIKNQPSQDNSANWSRLGCQHCQDRRSQDYRCQAYQAKGMMNWSCKFCDQGKDAHFKGVYSKKLFCTDPRHNDPRLQRWLDFTATADANGTTSAVIPPVATTVKTILCASCGKHGADGDIFCRGCGAPLATNVDESAPRDALSAASAV